MYVNDAEPATKIVFPIPTKRPNPTAAGMDWSSLQFYANAGYPGPGPGDSAERLSGADDEADVDEDPWDGDGEDDGYQSRRGYWRHSRV